jgi:hypothetical protein
MCNVDRLALVDGCVRGYGSSEGIEHELLSIPFSTSKDNFHVIVFSDEYLNDLIKLLNSSLK